MMGSSTAKSVAWSFLEQGGSKAVGLVVQVVLARLLAPEAFGLLAIMLVVVDIASSVANSGLGSALIQSKETDDLSRTTAFWLSMGLAVILYLTIFVASPIIALFYGMADLSNCLRAISLSIIFSAACSIQRSILLKRMDFKTIFKSNLSAVTLSGVAGIAAAVAGWGVWALVIQSITQPAFACFTMALQVHWHPTLSFDAGRAKSLYSYGWKICVTGIFGVIHTGISELIIGKACNVSDLGFYSQGRKWPNAGIHVASNALQNVMFPAFAKMQDDPERLRAAIRKALRVSNFVMVPLSLLTAASAEPLVLLLLGDKWLPCVPIFQITCAANCTLMLQLVNLRVYMALGDSGLYLKLQIIKVVASCVVIWSVAVLTGDIYWTAFATSACGVLCQVVVDLHPSERMHGVARSEQLRMFVPVMAVSIVAAVAAWAVMWLDLPPAALLVIQITVFTGVYLTLVRVFKVQGGRECFEAAREILSRK